MKKLFTILAAALITCGIMVAPAFAAEERTVLGNIPDDDGLVTVDSAQPRTPETIDWEQLIVGDHGGMVPRVLDTPRPGLDGGWDVKVLGHENLPKPNPDEHYVMLLDGTITTTKSDVVVDPDLVPTEVQDIQWEATDEGTPGAVMATAIDEKTAQQAAAEEFTKNHSSDGAVIVDKDSGYYPPEYTDVVVEEAWTETIEHPAVTHKETVSEGWQKAEHTDSYDFTGDKLIIHDGQSGYWFWTAEPFDKMHDFFNNVALSTDGCKQAYRAGIYIGYGDYVFGNKTFTIKPGNISATGQISWVAWDHQVTTTVIDKPAWTETVEHPAVTERIYWPGAGWANIVYLIPNEEPEPTPVPPVPVDPDPVVPVDPEDPVIPDEPIDPSVPSYEPSSSNSVPVDVVICDDTQLGTQEAISYLPKTGDTFGDNDSIIALIVVSICAILSIIVARKMEE